MKLNLEKQKVSYHEVTYNCEELSYTIFFKDYIIHTFVK